VSDPQRILVAELGRPAAGAPERRRRPADRRHRSRARPQSTGSRRAEL